MQRTMGCVKAMATCTLPEEFSTVKAVEGQGREYLKKKIGGVAVLQRSAMLKLCQP